MFLALTSQTEFWDANDEILFAGPWCARYDRRGAWENLRHRTLPDPWDDLERYRRATAYCDEVSERLLGPLTAYLNGVLSVRHTARYWRILLGRWLRFHVSEMYAHYATIEDAFTAYPDLETTLLDPATFQVPKDTHDVIQLSLKETYHLQIFSHFISARGRKYPVRRPASDNTPPLIIYPEKRAATIFKRVISRIFAAVIPPGLGDVLVSDLGLTRWERARFFIGSKFKALPYLADFPPDLKFETVWDERRKGLSRVAEGENAFERALISSLPHHLPTLYLEGYDPARKFSLARLWRTPRVLLTEIGWYGSEPFKFVAAECAERGSAVWCMQHGGGYGLFEHHEGEILERSIGDRFYSWGWAELAKDPKVKNLAHPHLGRASAPSKFDGVLYVPIAMLFQLMGVGRGASGAKMGAEYIERQARFLRTLPKTVSEKTATRVFVEFGWRHAERLRDQYPALRLDDLSKPFTDQLLKARVAVFDCPMTTFLQALAADVPSVLTWSPSSWTFRPAAQPYIDKLKEVGMLFDEPEDAARQVARVYDNPRAWWDSPTVQDARRAFTKRFALNREDWLDLWLEEIRGLSASDAPASR